MALRAQLRMVKFNVIGIAALSLSTKKDQSTFYQQKPFRWAEMYGGYEQCNIESSWYHEPRQCSWL